MCNNKYKRIETHWHLDTSNLKLLDCINTISDSLKIAVDMKLSGMALTDHETVASHVKITQAVRKMKKEGKMPEDFKLILGNEIYLVSSLEDVRDNYVGGGKTKFPHFILLSKSLQGHKALRLLSSEAWKNSFYTGMMERTPTEKEFMYNLLTQPDYKGTLMATSSCLGSESSIHILAMHEALESNNEEDATYHKSKLHEFIQWCIDLFGKDDFYLELQPSPDYEQRTVNLELLKLSKEYELKTIVANDVHYLRPEDREIHGAYLRSKESERETDSFYAHTYLHTIEETFKKLDYIPKEVIEKSFLNSLEIGDKCEDYTLEAVTEIPVSKLPSFEISHSLEAGYDKYKYIGQMANSESDQDRYLFHCIEQGFFEKIPYNTMSRERFHEYMDRIDSELGQLWELSIKMNKEIVNKESHQHMSSYYVTTLKIVELIWGDECGDDSLKEGSLLSPGRGSAVAFLINYLTGITLVNPMEYGIEIPYWRHLNHEMGDVSSLDIDLDVTSTKKKYIFQRMKDFFGNDNVIQVCTFGKEKPKSAINTACRGLGYDSDIAQYLGSFIKFERGEHWSLSDCLYGNEEEGRKPITEFVNEIDKYPKLRETALKIEGLINKRSTHAGGVMIYNRGYIESNALMRSPNGDFITQFNLDDSQATGGIKFDILVIEGNDKIQAVIELLLEHGVIDWKGTLRKTFEYYFHPEKIDKTSADMYKLIGEDKIPDLFQFSTSLAQSVIKKAKPSNLIETMAINSIMRLMASDGEQPIDTFVRFKNDISQWYKEMKDFGLNEEQIKVFEEHLLHLNGVADTQESIMLMAMDERIAGFDLFQSTKLRKAVSKKKKEEALKIRSTLFKKTEELGNDIIMAEYTWHQIERMLSYAFSSPHTLAYSLVSLIEANIFYKYSPIYWQTACLTVNSGSQELEEDDKKKDKNYGKVAEAIGKMKNYGVNVALPDINSAGFSFTPDADNNRIVYSLKGVVGLNDDVVREIISNRPYQSFEDFHTRLYETKLLQRKHVLNLIKAGSFNSFDNPIEIMKQFVAKEIDVKDKLNMQNIKSVLRLGLLDTPELSIYKEIMAFREHVNKLKPIRTIDKPKDTIVLLDQYSYEFYQKHFPTQSSVVGYSNGTEISTKGFKKEYDDKMQYIKDLMLDEEFVRKFNVAQFFEMWDTLADGTIPKWEMESVSFYSDEHELDGVDKERYGVTNYFDLSPEPIIAGYNKYMGRDTPKYKTFNIMGTVIQSDKNKHTVTVLTPEGVVTCKTYSGVFAHYNKTISKTINGKKETLEKSWFTRGNLVMMTGFRREDMFVLRTYAEKGQKKAHTVNLIKGIEEDGSLLLQSDRIKV